jgi:2-oxo-hept-3-ene-1,7-dioate hydratase
MRAVADRSSIDRAMKAQVQRFRAALAAGMPRLGWKIGINDPKMLERLGLEASVVGWLAGDRAVPAGGVYRIRAGTRVGLEAEVAVRVGGGGVVAALAPALEIVNYSTQAGSFEELLADDLFHDAVVIGRQTFPVPIADDTWPHVTINGVEVAQRDPGLLVLQPTATLRTVAATLARCGECLESGDWLILGTLIRPTPLHPGDRITADFGPLGTVTVEVAG